MNRRIVLPVNISLIGAVLEMRRRFGHFPDCSTWPDLQRACREEGIEIGPDRTYETESR